MSTDRCLFLDFDGVLNSRELITRQGRGDVLSSQAGRRVQEIIDRTGCKLVISSTWRILHSLGQLGAILRLIGVTEPILGKTPHRSTLTHRGAEIRAWLAENPQFVNFVVLDDEDFDMELVKDRLVKTDFATGLLPEHVEQAVALFEAQDKKLKSEA